MPIFLNWEGWKGKWQTQLPYGKCIFDTLALHSMKKSNSWAKSTSQKVYEIDVQEDINVLSGFL